MPQWALFIKEIGSGVDRILRLNSKDLPSHTLEHLDGQWRPACVLRSGDWSVHETGILTLAYTDDTEEVIEDLQAALEEWGVSYDMRCDGMLEGPVRSRSYCFNRVAADGSVKRRYGNADGGGGPDHRRQLEQMLAGDFEQVTADLKVYVASLAPPELLEALAPEAELSGSDALRTVLRAQADADVVDKVLINLLEVYPRLSFAVAHQPGLRAELMASTSRWDDIESINRLFKALRFKPRPADLSHVDATDPDHLPQWLVTQRSAGAPRAATVDYLRAMANRNSLAPIAERARAARSAIRSSGSAGARP
jgi:hypothetical protein